MTVNLRKRLFYTALVGTAGLCASQANAQQCLTSSQTGTNNGYYYSFWKDSGGSVQFLHAGRRPLHIELEQHQQLGGRQGLADRLAPDVSYSGTFNSPGNGYLTLYGWTTNPLDRVLHRRQLGHLSSAGRPGIHGHGDQRRRHVRHLPHAARQPALHHRQRDVLSVLERAAAKRTGGTITTGNHFNAWAITGHEPGHPQLPGHGDRGISEQRQLRHHRERRQQWRVGGGGSSGSSGGGGSKSFTVRARGTAGGESITLRVNNQNVQTWTLGTSMQNYTASTTLSGGITVAFTNDGGSRDVQVDYIIVNGADPPVRSAELQHRALCQRQLRRRRQQRMDALQRRHRLRQYSVT